MHRILIVFLAVAVIAGCAKKESEEQQSMTTTSQGQSSHEQMTAPSKQDVSDQTLSDLDPQIGIFIKKVDELKQAYESSKTPESKTKLVDAYIAFGDYMTNDSPVSPRQGKYHRALLEYRKAIALDPHNQKAIDQINLIEGIYRDMGRPIPGA